MVTWAKWLEEGYFYSYLQEKTRFYFMVYSRDFAHVEYQWPNTIATLTLDGPVTPADLETTDTKQIWQIIFGITPQCRIYVSMPTETARHGVAKKPQWTTTFSTVGHFEAEMSQWEQPSWITEHFMVRPITTFIAFTCYNPNVITIRPRLNFYIAKCDMEPIGSEYNGVLTPASNRYSETLEKLYKRLIPHRPLTLLPVRAPAEAP